MNTNCMFPSIEYKSSKSELDWGRQHGEEFKKPIKELSLIRRELMLKKNPKLQPKLDELALAQWNISHQYAPAISQELKGIVEGSGLTLTDIVILNNYTDFRDINLPDEGCSTIHLQNNGHVSAGQTWDMHRSAKNYMCLLHLPDQIILTLVGCVGLMGVNTHNCLVGVNNINTKNANIGMIWPILVRKILGEKNLSDMKSVLLNAPVTSGHNYLLSTAEGGVHIEVTPNISEIASTIEKNQNGCIFHTNHCLTKSIMDLEDKSSLSSTTFNRYNLIEQKKSCLSDMEDLKSLLTDHDEFPKSICSHFENGVQDPSFTCGGGVSDLINGRHIFWRGCPAHDSDYKEYEFKLDNNSFIKVR